MSRGARRRQRQQPRTLQVFLIIVLVLLTVCVLVKAFFLKAPEQKAAAGAYGREVIFQYYSVRRMAAPTVERRSSTAASGCP